MEMTRITIAIALVAAATAYGKPQRIKRPDIAQDNALLKAVRLTAGEMLRATNLTAEQAAEIASVFEPWRVGVAYSVGDVRRYDGDLYECIQPHTSQSDWTPDAVPALWKSHAPAGVIPEWVQPTGAHDAYQTGDLVTFEGQVWRSVIDANVWSPTAYPAGWELQE